MDVSFLKKRKLKFQCQKNTVKDGLNSSFQFPVSITPVDEVSTNETDVTENGAQATGGNPVQMEADAEVEALKKKIKKTNILVFELEPLWLHFSGCMHLMCTAIHSSHCLSCCTCYIFFLSPLLVAHGFVPRSLSNLILMVAVSCDHYLNLVGCNVLPFLEKTTVFPYPIRITIILTPIFGLNPSNMYSDKMIFQRLQREFEAALACQTQGSE
ncbi:hypothetical protein L1987_77909 [Smallanthus sonchifolius]|uniref:Uncharacterized protein n=1 Tax=Smallanthus sonchifolius TaxID=185202 RepID=A0ACB8ZB50_9ASTR|nr:hypothetical protein L1987_77909 [Smallanthus sonchifolius]